MLRNLVLRRTSAAQFFLRTAVLTAIGLGLFLPATNHATGQLLTSIDVTPSLPTLEPGETQQFTATGHYSDGSSKTLTGGGGTWAATGSMATARIYHTATRLPDGSVLVVGGYNAPAGLVFASAERYNPATHTWSSAGSMTHPRLGHSATLLPNGKVIVVGGRQAPASNQTDTTEIYDPNTNSWSAGPSLLLGLREAHSAILLNTGKLLVAAGLRSYPDCAYRADAELYNYVTNSWAITGSLSLARSSATTTLLSNGKVLLAAGPQNGCPTPNVGMSEAEIYDPAVGTWSVTGSLPGTRYNNFIAALPNGNALIAGGVAHNILPTYLASTAVYNTVTGTFAASGSMATARVATGGAGDNGTAVVLENGDVLVTGGSNISGMLSSAELYTTTTGLWTATGSMATARTYNTTTLLQDGTVLVVGGQGNASPTLASAEIYTPKVSWSSSNPAVATVDQTTGLVTAVATGTTNLKVSSGPISGFTTLTVERDSIPPSTTASYAAPNVNGWHRANVAVTLTTTDSGGSASSSGVQSLTYSLSGAQSGGGTGTVSADGSSATASLTITNEGTTFVTYHAVDNNGNVEPDVTITIKLDKTPPTLSGLSNITTNATSSAGAVVTFSPATFDAVSGVNSVAVTQGLPSGSIFPHGTTTEQVTVTDNAGNSTSQNFTVTVSKVLTAIDVTPATATIAAGQTNQQFIATGVYTDQSSSVLGVSGGSWLPTGSLATPRYYHTATRLQDGSVLVVGGYDPSANLVFASAERYNPATHMWTSAGSMTHTRLGHSATLLPNGKVIVVGGRQAPASNQTNTTEIYDPTTNNWSAGPALLLGVREAHSAIMLNTGKLLVAAGLQSYPDCTYRTDAELYDPVGNSWSVTGSLHLARSSASTTLLSNGKVLLAGGPQNSCPTPNVGMTQAEVYDPAAGTWTVTGNLSVPRYANAIALLPNSKVLLAGGISTPGIVASADLYDPATGTFTPTASMGTPRQTSVGVGDNGAMPVLRDGQMLFAGGHNGTSIVASAELFDPNSNSWITTGSMNVPRLHHTETLLQDGTVLAVGGTATGPAPLGSAEIYTPPSLIWTSTNTAVATITQSGLATGNANGTTTISASVAAISGAASLTVDRDTPPTAQFTANPNPAACTQSITFNAGGSSAGPGLGIVSYSWNFGDGATGSGAMTTHAYSAFGTYTATLTVTDNHVPAQTDTESLIVQVNLGNQPPIANHGGPYLADLGMPFTLNGSGSSDPNTACGDSITTYSWSINNGAILLTGAQPSLMAAQISALGVGTFPVSLTVTDTFGTTGTASTTLSIYNNVPTASFSANPNPAACSQSITFDGTFSTAGRPDRHIVSYSWNFGDSSTANGAMVTHSFAAFGIYAVTLIVNDDSAPSKTDSHVVTVNVNQGNLPPFANHGGPYSVNQGAAVTLNGGGSSDFNASCGDSIVSYAWTIDGTQQLNGVSPTLNTATTPLSVGSHTVTLTVTDEFGLTGSASTTLNVQKVLVSIAVTPATVTLQRGQQQTFTATGTFSDGSTEQLLSGNNGGGGGGGGFFGPGDLQWQIQFHQGGDFSACSTPQYPIVGGGWTSQNLLPHDGEVHMTWSPGTPVVNVDGTVTLTDVALTVACTNGAATGTIEATWTGTRYEGVLFFDGAIRSTVSITGWSSKTAMPMARFGLTAAAAGGHVYAIGGVEGACAGSGPCPYGPLPRVDVYDPANDSWSAGPFLSTGRESGRAVALGTKIYVIGGHIPGGQASGVVEVLDVASPGGWMTLSSDPMPTARANFALVTDGTYLYAIGGDTTSGNGGAVSVVERFDPTAPAGQRWTTLMSMPVAGNSIGAGVLGGTIVVAGAGGTSRTDIYDIASNSWSPGVPMPAQRGGMASAVPNGGLWLIGGTTNGSLNFDTWVYYPASPNRPAGWAGVGSMLTGRWALAAASIGDVIYAVGGADMSTIALASNESLSTPPFDDLSTSGGSSGGSGGSGNGPITVQWQSTNAAASIDSNGNATAMAIGEATIVASAGSISCQTTNSCATLTVTNTVPVVQIFGGPFTTDESANFQNFFSGGSFNDLDLQSWTATVDYGDGSGVQPLNLSNLQNGFTPTGQFSLNHMYTDNGVFTVTVSVDDHAGGIGTIAVQVTVNNRVPQVSGPNSARVNTNSAQMIGCISFFDVPADAPWTATVNYGDGSGDQNVIPNVPGSCGGGGGGNGPVGAFNLSHMYANGGTFTVTAKVTDKDHGTGTYSFPITVNAPPAVAIDNTPLAHVNEGSPFSGTASFTDAPGDGPWTVRISYGDNTGQFQSSVNNIGSIPLNHVYRDNGSFTISVQVQDSSFASATATATLVVDNVAPTVANLPTLNPINEGQQVSFTVNFTDPGINDTQMPGSKANINWGDGSSQQLNVFANNGNGSFFVNHNYPDNPSGGGAFTITVTVTDKDGAISAAKTTEIVVNNQMPDVQLNGFPHPEDGSPATFNGQLFDPGALDAPWTGSVDFGDASSQPLVFNLNPVGQTPRGTFSITHTYHLAGPVTVTFTVTDKDGATRVRTLSLFVDPAFVSATISPNPAWMKSIGQSLLFNATALFSDGSTQSTNGQVIDGVTWSSSNPNVATIGPGGLATATGPGITTIGLLVHDDQGRTFTTQSILTVDVMAPVITANDVTVEATSGSGANVNLMFSATDDFDPAPAVSADHASGTFPIGATDVIVTATDDAGNTSHKTVHINVVDTTLPVISVPANITVDAMSPAGAAVSYVVSATDGITPNLVVTCNPPSGSVFAIGTTTVTCTTADAAGNSATASFTVTVLGAVAQVANVINTVVTFNLQSGIENSLDTKLQNVIDALNSMSNNDVANACGKLSAFINEVAAQSSKKLTVAQANQLTAAALQIKAVIGC